MGHLFKDCPLNKTREVSPKITPISSRGVSPIIPRPSQGSASARGSPVKAGSQGRGTSSPPMMRARAATAAAQTSGTVQTPSSFSLGISSDIVISNASCTMAHCSITSPHLNSSTNPPTLPPSHSPSSLSSSRNTSSHPYSLRPRPHPSNSSGTQAGLGIIPLGLESLTSRGRKSDLSKAIWQAGAEVASGCQSTIDEVLRASKTPSGPP